MFRAPQLDGVFRAVQREDVTGASGDYSRFAGLTLIAVGLAHAAIPDPMLRLARWGYAAVLDAHFRRGETTKRRVRLVGLSMVLVGAHLLYHGGIRPSEFE